MKPLIAPWKLRTTFAVVTLAQLVVMVCTRYTIIRVISAAEILLLAASLAYYERSVHRLRQVLIAGGGPLPGPMKSPPVE